MASADDLAMAMSTATVTDTTNAQGQVSAEDMGALPLHSEQVDVAGLSKEAILKQLGKDTLAGDISSPDSDTDSDNDTRWTKSNATRSKLNQRLVELDQQEENIMAKRERVKVTTYLTALRKGITDEVSATKYNMLYTIAETMAGDSRFLREVQTVTDVSTPVVKPACVC